MINAIEIKNWKTTRLLCNNFLCSPFDDEPFKTFIVLKEDKKKAG